MPLNISPSNASPEGKPQGHVAKYTPARMSPGMHGNTAPVPGEQAPEQRAPARETAPQQADGQQQEEVDESGGDKDLAFRLGLLSKKDQAARERIAEARAAEARLKSREDAIAAREAKLKEWESRDAERRRSPRRVLEDYGYSPEAALQFELNKGQLTPDQQLALTVDEKLAEERRAREESLLKFQQEQEERDRKAKEEEDRQRQQDLSAQESEAVEELKADIGTIIGEDPRSFPLVRKAADRGVAAVYARVQDISNEHFEQTGRRPPLSTKLLERAAAEVEQAAQKEYRETMQDPDVAQALGLGGPAPRPRAPSTLTNQMQRAPSGQQRPETEQEKRERVKAQLDDIFRRRAGR